MLERIAIFATIGAVLAHDLDFGPIPIAGAAAGACLLPLRRSALFAAALAIGAVMIGHAARPADALVGERSFLATVRSVDRGLSATSIVVREGTYRHELFLSRQGEFLPGDTVRVEALLEAPEPFATDTGRIFAYDRYLQSKGISSIGRDADVRLVRRGKPSPARIGTILRFYIADIYARYVSFPVDGILAGMTVGYQGGIPEEVEELFRDTGVLHVLVLSGYNITLLAGFLAMLLGGLPVRVRAGTTMLAIALLVLVSGSGSASVRAGIMGAIALLANLSLRTYRPLRALAVAYLCFFCASPLAVFYDPGLHLSFLATAFMVLLLPIVLPRLSFLPRYMREPLALAVLLPLFMLPYTMHFSGLVPLAAPLANIALAAAIPLFMALSCVLLAVSWCAPLAALLGVLLSLAGRHTVGFLQLVSALPVWQAPPLSGAAVLGSYAVLVFLATRRSWRRRSAAQPASS